MEKERHVLVVFPHPDDEAFGVSGTISSHIESGTPVTYACLTLGEMGRNMGNPPFATRESLPNIRKKELQDAANILGIKDLRMLGYRDKTIEFENEEVVAAHMASIIKDVNPSLIITFYPGYAVHPDHDATGAAVIRAVREMPAEERPKVHCVAFSHNCEEEIGQADVVNDVSAFVDKKLATIKAHVSQTQLVVSQMAINLENQDPEYVARFHNERFWTYKF